MPSVGWGIQVLWDFQIQTDKMAVPNRPDMLGNDKQEKKGLVVGFAIRSNSSIRTKENKKACGDKKTLRALTQKLGEWL